MLKQFALLGIATLAVAGIATPTVHQAAAQGLEFRLEDGRIKPRVVVPDQDDEYVAPRHHARNQCDLDDAEDVAREEGLHRPQIVSVTKRRIVIEGNTEDGRDTVIIGNRPGCPVVG